MDYQARLSLSFYREIAAINSEHKIYLVQHIKTNKIYVKKVLDVYNYSVYQQLASNPIPGIPRIYALCEENAALTVIEEYISGETLQEILDRCGLLHESLVAAYIIQLCDILSKLHGLHIVHRDIKPSNIIVDQFGQITLLDLNAAKYADPSKKEDTVLLGTNGFAAPEQYGFGSSGFQTDIYAIGILINTLLSGASPIHQTSVGRFTPIVKKCTQLNPADRYQSVAALKKAVINLHLSENVSKLPNEKAFLPPGYRTGNASHMIFATIGYVLIIILGFSLEIKTPTLAILWIERIFFVISMFVMVLFTCNYRNIQHHFPLCSSKNILIQMIGVLLFDVLIFLLLILIMAIIEAGFTLLF